MKVRLATVVVTAIALGSLSACGSSQSDTATPSPQPAVTTVVTITQAPTTTPLPTETAGTTEDETSTLQPAPTTTTVANPGDGGADYVGHFQRHESTLDLASDGTGKLLMGASAVDGETWAVTWQASDPGVAITLDRRTALYGRGLEAGLAPGEQFTARFTTGETGNRVLETGPIGPQIGTQIWCGIGGPSPECGA